MQVGIFGGSFNPFHKGHKVIIEELLKKKYVDKIIIMPTGDLYKWKDNLETQDDRIQMIKIALGKLMDEGLDIEISDFEGRQKRAVNTEETLRQMKKEYPKDDIYFVCGLDNLATIKEWYNYEYILKECKVLVINRENMTLNVDEIMKELEEYKNNIVITDIVVEGISSTTIREEIVSKKSKIPGLDKKVLDYILEKKMY